MNDSNDSNWMSWRHVSNRHCLCLSIVATAMARALQFFFVFILILLFTPNLWIAMSSIEIDSPKKTGDKDAHIWNDEQKIAKDFFSAFLFFAANFFQPSKKGKLLPGSCQKKIAKNNYFLFLLQRNTSTMNWNGIETGREWEWEISTKRTFLSMKLIDAICALHCNVHKCAHCALTMCYWCVNKSKIKVSCSSYSLVQNDKRIKGEHFLFWKLLLLP